MNKGKTLPELCNEIERQHKTKVDYLVPSAKLRMRETAHVLVEGHGEFIPNQLAHNQLAEKLGIPKPYYERMLGEDSTLLASNVNTWLGKQPEQVRMVRTLDGKMRSLLSDRYRPLDYMDLAHMAFPALVELGLSVESSEITDTRMYLKATSEKLTAEVRRGQTIRWGIRISNSEVGAGALDLAGFSVILQCLNGMTHESVFRRNHVGVRNETEGAQVFFQDDTKKANDKALWLQFRDTLRGILSEDHFGTVVQKFQQADRREMSNPVKTIQVVVQRYGLNQGDGESLFKYLNDSKQFNQNGLVNAITRYAEDQKDYDRSSDLEALGGKLLDLTDDGWQEFETEKVTRKRELVA